MCNNLPYKFLKSFDNNSYVVGVFINLTKAFGMVDHNILLRNFFHYGVKGSALKFLQIHQITYHLQKY